MRPLCGAIITGGALIGLGLFALGFGTRYAGHAERNAEGHFREDYWVKLSQMDTPLLIILVLLAASLVIGLGIAFTGLAYHHHKRQLEMLRNRSHTDRAQTTGPRVTT
jgi:hypothetical protein